MQSINKKLLFFVVVLFFVLGASVLFRERISGMLSFNRGTISKPIDDKRDAVFSENEKNQPAPLVLGSFQQQQPSKQSPSKYTGRDPGEYRPVPDEVKLFTDSQKAQIKYTLETHAKSVKEIPTYFYGWIQIGLLKKTIGDFEGARDAWEYASVIEPLNSLSFANLGELYWRYLHDYPKSENNLKISIEHKPDDIFTYVSLAELYHYSFTEKKDLADDVLLNGLKANPENDTLMRRLAYLYEQRSEWGNALSWWQKVLEKKPDDKEVIAKISQLKTKL